MKSEDDDRREAAVAEARWSAGMAAAQRGDTETYHKLLEELLPLVSRLVRAKLFDHPSADDVIQNALLSIHRARHTYRPERPFGPWMRTIVRHAVIDAFRDRKRRAAREVAVEAIEGLLDPDSGEEPALERNELSPALQAALSELPDKHRQAVELIHLRGFSVAEAAVRVGVSPGALKVRAHRGYRALRARLRGQES